MHYTAHDIQTIVCAEWLQMGNTAGIIDRLIFDTRQLSDPDQACFFALRGQRHDGHDFLRDAAEKGVRTFILSDKSKAIGLPAEANILLVADTLAALQQLAAHHRRQFSLPVIGITGSNGKTIVKEWLFQLLHKHYRIVRSPKSYNSQIGVPLSVWQIKPEHTLGIFEAGISKPGEMPALEQIIRPDIGIFTNIGPAHREGFASKADKVAEKMRLFEHCKLLLYRKDSEYIDSAAMAWKSAAPGRKTCTWASSGIEADLVIHSIARLPNGKARIEGHWQGATAIRFEIPFDDDPGIENALHCCTVLLALGLEPDKIPTLLRRLEPIEMRLEIKEAVNRSILIDDTYNLDLTSLRMGMDFAARQRHSGKHTLVLSDILQSGLEQPLLWEKVAHLIQDKGFTRIFGIGSEIVFLKKLLPRDFPAVFFKDTDAFLQQLPDIDFSEEVILLKGARFYQFERIARRLEQKAHKTVLEVNLSAILHNLGVYAQCLQPGVKILAMVKASAYGSGSVEVAKLLEFHRVDYLSVAYTDEGKELRKAGISLPILVLNPEERSFETILRYRLEPEIYSLGSLKAWLAFLGKGKKAEVHLKLDTGMHRLGFERRDLPELLELLGSHPNLMVKSIFSHLAASDAPVHDDFTRLQVDNFQFLYGEISAVLGYKPLRHVVNTGGIARFPAFHFDMVRLGIGLYGIDSSGLQPKLRTVNTLKATISQIKEIPAGETVGYNRRGVAEHNIRTATLSIGYADGLLRLAGNGRYAVGIRGKRAPIVGSVCMDMTMVDVSQIPEAREGDEVIVFGEHFPVTELADALQTIPYEVFTNISDRVKRVYVQE